jgi:hypothetical protein
MEDVVDAQAIGREVTFGPGIDPTDVGSSIFANQTYGPGREPVIEWGQAAFEACLLAFCLGERRMPAARHKAEILVMIGFVVGLADR